MQLRNIHEIQIPKIVYIVNLIYIVPQCSKSIIRRIRLTILFQSPQICQKHFLVNDANVFPSINNTEISQTQFRK
jgi:hypothetical protein